MLDNCVVSFYDNFGLIFKNSEDTATNGIKNWSLSTASLLTEASSRENRANIRINLIVRLHVELHMYNFLHVAGDM